MLREFGAVFIPERRSKKKFVKLKRKNGRTMHLRLGSTEKRGKKKRRRKEKLPSKNSVGRVELEYYVERSAKVKLGPPGRVPS